jgi:hypothetical protein
MCKLGDAPIIGRCYRCCPRPHSTLLSASDWPGDYRAGSPSRATPWKPARLLPPTTYLVTAGQRTLAPRRVRARPRILPCLQRVRPFYCLQDSLRVPARFFSLSRFLRSWGTLGTSLARAGEGRGASGGTVRNLPLRSRPQRTLTRLDEFAMNRSSGSPFYAALERAGRECVWNYFTQRYGLLLLCARLE